MTIDALVRVATFRQVAMPDVEGSDAVTEVIEVDGRPVGHIVVAPMPGVPGGRTVLDLTVHPEHRGRGIGTTALLRWAELAHEAGGPLTLTVTEGDPDIDWYRSLGFRSVRAACSTSVRMVLDIHDRGWR
jgi:ribosomal protein S18 acetylase RimI-like enzyme